MRVSGYGLCGCAHPCTDTGGMGVRRVVVLMIDGMRGHAELHRTHDKHENDEERKDKGLFESHLIK